MVRLSRFVQVACLLFSPACRLLEHILAAWKQDLSGRSAGLISKQRTCNKHPPNMQGGGLSPYFCWGFPVSGAEPAQRVFRNQEAVTHLALNLSQCVLPLGWPLDQTEPGWRLEGGYVQKDVQGMEKGHRLPAYEVRAETESWRTWRVQRSTAGVRLVEVIGRNVACMFPDRIFLLIAT